MPNINDVFPSKYLRSDDFGGIDGQPVLAKVSHTTMEMMEDAKKKICLWLDGYDKGLLLNKTNATTIASYAGPDTDHWAGQHVVVYVAMVEYQGKSSEGIRVRQPKNRPPATPPKPPVAASVPPGHPDADTPF